MGWTGGLVEWWSGGLVDWWSGGVVEWWSGGVVEWWRLIEVYALGTGNFSAFSAIRPQCGPVFGASQNSAFDLNGTTVLSKSDSLK
jgi:hypothetical protein